MTGRISGPGPQRGLALEPGQPLPALQPGQVVTASVESVQGREAVLRLLGALVRARAEVPLVPGEVLDLWVAAAGPDHVHLRRLDAGPAGAPGGPPPGRAAPGGAAPGSAPPAAGSESLAARALAAYRLPLDPAQVDRIARLIAPLPEAERELAASAAARLVAAGQVPTPAAVREMAAAAAGPTPFALRPRLLALAAALESAAAQAPGSGLAARLRALAAELRAWGWRSGPRPGGAGGGAPGGPAPGPQPAPQPVPQPGPQPVPLRALAAVLADAADQAAELPQVQQEVLRPPLRDASGLLDALRQLEAPPSAAGAETAAGRETRAGTEAAAGADAWAAIPLPFAHGRLEGEALLLRRQRGGRRPGSGEEPEELHLYVETPHLGPLAVRLTWHRGALAATVTAAEAAAAAALAAALPRLAGALRERGLPVADLRAVAGNAAPPPVLAPPAPEPPRGLDRRL